jgi:signal transduction histidine kinase/CheY-like chemotaxis protein
MPTRPAGNDTPSFILHFLGALTPPERQAAVRALAEALGAEALYLCLRDASGGDLVPPLGLPGPPGSWASFLRDITAGTRQARLPLPEGGSATVFAFPLGEGAVLALVGEGAERAATLESQLRETIRQLEAAARVKDELLATLAQELRAPLGTILGWVRLLRSRDLDEATRMRAVEAILRSTHAQAQVVSDAVDISEIVAGRLRLETKPVDLVQMVTAAVDALRPAARAKDVRLSRTLAGEQAWVEGDPSRLEQMFTSLLRNAIELTPRSGSVQARLERSDTEAIVTIEDGGPSIEAQASQPGLGVAVARHLARLHGAAVESANRREGTGAATAVRLPRLRLDAVPPVPRVAEPAAKDAPPDQPLRLDGVSVLVVEDDLETREVVSMVLGRHGAQVTLAASAADGLEALDRARPHVIVADLDMPRMDGCAFMEAVRRRPADQGGAIPAAALTAHASATDRLRTLRAGFQIHLPKPVEPFELTSVVASLVQRSAGPRGQQPRG